MQCVSTSDSYIQVCYDILAEDFYTKLCDALIQFMLIVGVGRLSSIHW